MKGWRTLGFNAAAALLTVVTTASWPELLPAYPWVAPLIITFGNAALRFITTSPVGTPA